MSDDNTCKNAVRLEESKVKELLVSLKNWQVIDAKLEKELSYNNFQEALVAVNQIAEIAETQNHHPDIFLAWGYVKVSIWTHSVGGITELDFQLARQIDEL